MRFLTLTPTCVSCSSFDVLGLVRVLIFGLYLGSLLVCPFTFERTCPLSPNVCATSFTAMDLWAKRNFETLPETREGTRVVTEDLRSSINSPVRDGTEMELSSVISKLRKTTVPKSASTDLDRRPTSLTHV